MIENELIKNSGRLHTTEMGVNRIKKNLALDCDDVVEWCKNQSAPCILQNIYRTQCSRIFCKKPELEYL